MARTDYTSDSSKGYDRDSNKDDTLVLETKDYSLFVVFDGVSSTKEAKVIIDLAKEYISSHINELKSGNISLKKLFHDANEHLLKEQDSDGASTYVALFIDNESESASISWLGDSRIYSYDKDEHEVNQITTDHADPNESHIVTKGLGFKELKESDFVEKAVDSKNNYILCTDGFYEFFEEDAEDLLEVLLLDDLSEVKKAFKFMIHGDNADDATYLITELG